MIEYVELYYWIIDGAFVLGSFLFGAAVVLVAVWEYLTRGE